MKNYFKYTTLILLTLCLSSCGFHLQSEVPLAPALHHLYLQSSEPYGTLARNLKQYLTMSKVELATTPAEAETIFIISRDQNTQELLSVNSTQQTRQYNIHVLVDFYITDAKGKIILTNQSLVETRIITVQANQILGSSNASFLLYQDMRRDIAYAILNRLASNEVTRIINSDQRKP